VIFADPSAFPPPHPHSPSCEGSFAAIKDEEPSFPRVQMCMFLTFFFSFLRVFLRGLGVPKRILSRAALVSLKKFAPLIGFF